MSGLMFRLGFLTLCGIAAWLPFTEKNNRVRSEHFPGWPATWEGEPIRQIPLSERELTFNESFPGRIAKFTDGRRELIFRWVTKGTRQLHSSADCFRGLGYRVHPRAAMQDAHGARWSCFSAVRGSTRLFVREHITDERGGEWTDVSAWFWSVLLRQTEAPWLAVTVVDPEHNARDQGF